MNVHIRAQFVARIFDVLAWVILGIGGLAGIYGIVAFFGAPAEGLLILLVVAVQTAIAWAVISLAAVVAGYIAHRTASDAPA